MIYDAETWGKTKKEENRLDIGPTSFEIYAWCDTKKTR